MAAAVQRGLQRGRVVAGVQQRAGGSAIGKGVRGHQVAAHHVQRVQPKLNTDAGHQPLQREINLRSAEAAVEAGRQLVGHHHAIADANVGDGVGAGHVAVHAVQGCRLRRAQVRTAILHLVPIQRQNAPVRSHRGLQFRVPVGGRDGPGKVLHPVLDPLHRPVHYPCGGGDQHDVGEHALLYAEAAARVRRRPQPQPVARHSQRAGDDGVNAERPLEVCQHVIRVQPRVVLRHHAVGLDRRAGAAGVVHGDADRMGSLCEGSVGVAVAEAAVAGDVAGEAIVQQRRTGRQGSQRLKHRRQRSIADLDQVKRILRHIAIHGDNEGYGFAHVAHSVGRDGPALDRRLHADDQAGGDGAQVRPGQDRGDAGQCAGVGGIQARDVRVCVRGTQDGCIQRARRRADVVYVAAPPTQQRRILHPRQRAADPAQRACIGVQGALQSCLISTSLNPTGGSPPPGYPRVASLTHASHCYGPAAMPRAAGPAGIRRGTRSASRRRGFGRSG